MADTLGDMKDRISDELARFDLADQTENAIFDAISAYNDERFFFNETRAITFPSVQGQEFYDGNDSASIPLIQKIDYVNLFIQNSPYKLHATYPWQIELDSQNGTMQGSPSSYCWYSEQIRFYPVPNNSTWTFRIGASIKVAAPAADIETGNPWMRRDYAERLIRSRAKYELAVHVLKDPQLASVFSPNVKEAFDQLVSRTQALTQVGQGRVEPMEF